jgi:hypothetical protein
MGFHQLRHFYATGKKQKGGVVNLNNSFLANLRGKKQTNKKESHLLRETLIRGSL